MQTPKEILEDEIFRKASTDGVYAIAFALMEMANELNDLQVCLEIIAGSIAEIGKGEA